MRFFTPLSKLFVKKYSKSASTFCPVCGDNQVTFLPLPDFYRENALRHGFAYLDKGEMTELETYSCDKCGASDRERLYALWLDQTIAAKGFKNGTRVIHFAPEAPLSNKLKTLPLFEYGTADLLMEHVDYQVDMMKLPFDDNSYDFFICSHVLEHVESDDLAIQELYRITKPGGCGILMAPIIMGLDKTLEDPSVTDEAGRWRLFGQNDHVRLYAHDDYTRKIRGHGFRLDELGEDHFGAETFRSLGLKRSSILYVAYK